MVCIPSSFRASAKVAASMLPGWNGVGRRSAGVSSSGLICLKLLARFVLVDEKSWSVWMSTRLFTILIQHAELDLLLQVSRVSLCR